MNRSSFKTHQRSDLRQKMVAETLHRVRKKLIDLSRRNPLLNFRENRRSIPIVDELPNEVFRLLISKGRQMEFLPFEPPEENEEKKSSFENGQELIPFKNEVEKTQLEASPDQKDRGIKTNGRPVGSPNINKTYELPHPTKILETKHIDNCLQTPLLAKPLERRCKNILRHWRTGIEEAGINYLYLAIGFLEWQESDSSDIINKAPLILVPLHIERTRLNSKTNCYTYVVSYSGEDIETNLSLAEKLDHDFDLILPEITEDTTPEDYFSEVNNTIKKKKRWRVAREMIVGFFSFAKLRLYKDLDNDSWPGGNKLTDHKIIQDVLIGVENAGGGASVTPCEEYDLDKDPNADKVPIVVDADSSQHSAIIDVVLKGKNLVIEGPPGTGKSQSITNIIAAALHENKNVLFVSEKKAALEVVRNRLDALGLGDFCLELHSHKTQKGQLHADLAKRLNQRYKDSKVLDYEIKEFRKERDKLRRYYDLLNSIPGKSSETVCEIFWAAERWGNEVKDRIKSFTVDNALQLPVEQIRSSERALEDFLRLSDELPDEMIRIWKGFEPSMLLPSEERAIEEKLCEIEEETEKFLENLKEISKRSKKQIVDLKMSSIQKFAQIETDVLGPRPTGWNKKVAGKFLNREASHVLENLVQIISRQKELAKEANRTLEGISDMSSEELQFINEKLDLIEGFGYGEATFKELRSLEKKATMVAKLVEELKELAQDLTMLIPEPPNRFKDLVRINKIYKLVDSAPPEIYLNPHPGYALGIANPFKELAYQEYETLVEIFEELSDYFDIDHVPDLKTVAELRETFSKYDKWWKRIFSMRSRRARKRISKFISKKKVMKDPQLVDHLTRLMETLQRVSVYEKNEDFKKVLGSYFAGMKTNWIRLNKLVDWSQQLRKTMGSEKCASLFLSDFVENRERVLLTGRKLRQIWSSVRRGLEQLNVIVKTDDKIQTVLEALQYRNAVLQAFLDDLAMRYPNFTGSIKALHRAAEEILESRSLYQAMEDDDRFPAYFGELYEGLDTDIETLQGMQKWVTGLTLRAGLPKDLARWVLAKDTESRLSTVYSLAAHCREYLFKFNAFNKFLDKAQKTGAFSLEEWIGVPFDNIDLISFLEKVRLCKGTAQYLVAWSDYCNIRKRVQELGLSPIVCMIEDKSIEKERAIAGFRYALYKSMAGELMRRYPQLASFRRSTYDSIRERISRLDRELQRCFRERIAYRISRRSVPSGISSGYVRDYTELSLIKHELSKKKRHIPIRQLVRRASAALMAIKPCFMMSPQSVAQYLPPGKIRFDLLVMDEASQLRLEDALGAIARSEQVVVVGDPKQLPPTTFFERIIEGDDGEEETTAAEEAESILDICQNCYDTRRLRWHYRSEHENLIAFSNSEFYDNDLIVFPCCRPSDPQYGIRYHFVENGYYQKGRNRTEARKVAAAVMEHFKRSPELSLGVATFNIEQRDLIHDELERLQKANPWLEQRIKETEKSEEPFFIKNLENVQGDERDVIFVSTTYGPDRESGQVYQRFGPINRPMGWRRLNVIVTRAKKRLELFTSMKSSDIRVTPGVSRGVVALRNYLKYAEKGTIDESGIRTGKEPDSDFEIAVANLLEQHGYRTAFQVGVAGFFIDIGIYHPDREGEFILGVECDGATYHSHKSIRDRDLLRQRILESKGWRIYRIWSTDWFKNREKEIQNLLKYLGALVEADRIKLSQKEQHYETAIHKKSIEVLTEELEQGDEQLRKHLLEYRRKKIEPVLKDMSKSILSDRLLEEFIRKKPTSKEEFWNFPLRVRENIDPSQGRFLDEILDIIEDFV